MRITSPAERSLRLLGAIVVFIAGIGLAPLPAPGATLGSVVLTDLSTFDASGADANDYYVITGTSETDICGASCITFESHFSANAGLAADLWDFDDIVTFVWSYQTDVVVSAAAGEQWELGIDTRMLGALTLVDSAAGNARSVLNDLTGTYSGPGTTSGSLDLTGFGTLAGAAGGNTPGSSSASFLVTSGVGPASITVTYTVGGEVFSDCGGFLCLGAGDQASVRFGALDPGTLDPGFTAGDYPGVGLRTLGNDGLFARFTLTTVPEPSTAALACLGLLALAFAGRSRRFTRRPSA